jgi:hypothetical protein
VNDAIEIRNEINASLSSKNLKDLVNLSKKKYDLKGWFFEIEDLCDATLDNWRFKESEFKAAGVSNLSDLRAEFEKKVNEIKGIIDVSRKKFEEFIFEYEFGNIHAALKNDNKFLTSKIMELEKNLKGVSIVLDNIKKTFGDYGEAINNLYDTLGNISIEINNEYVRTNTFNTLVGEVKELRRDIKNVSEKINIVKIN